MKPIEFDVVRVNPQGDIIERDRKTTQGFIEAEFNLTMVAIPAGSFVMGSPTTEEGAHPSQTPQHTVKLAGFYISQYPITQAQWQAVAKLPKCDRSVASQIAHFSGETRPIEQVSWWEAREFCARLSQACQKNYTLPSEAQWEYACRANTNNPFHFGETITTELANYSGIDWDYQGKICSKGSYGAGPFGCDRRETTPVGTFGAANEFGLFDLHGNVREWCADVWHPHYQDAPTDGSAWIIGGNPTKRVLRGGSWNTGPQFCRSAYRGKFEADASLYDIGFRIICVD